MLGRFKVNNSFNQPSEIVKENKANPPVRQAFIQTAKLFLFVSLLIKKVGVNVSFNSISTVV